MRVFRLIDGVGKGRDGRREDGRRADDFKFAGADHQSQLPFRGTSSGGLQRWGVRLIEVPSRRISTASWAWGWCSPIARPASPRLPATATTPALRPPARRPRNRSTCRCRTRSRCCRSTTTACLLNLPLPPVNGARVADRTTDLRGQHRDQQSDPRHLQGLYGRSDVSHLHDRLPGTIHRLSFIDSGSNGFFYDNPGLAALPGSPRIVVLSGGADRPTRDHHRLRRTQFDSGQLRHRQRGAICSRPATRRSSTWAPTLAPECSIGGCRFSSAARCSSGLPARPSPGVTESTPLWAYK